MSRLLKSILTLMLIMSYINSEAQSLSTEEKQLCIDTFNKYLVTDKKHFIESEKLYRLMIKHSQISKEEKDQAITWYQHNLVHIDSLMNACIVLAEQNKSEELVTLLESERNNIMAHPNNDVYNEWQLQSVMALLYSGLIPDDTELYSKLAPLAEWSKMHIEAIQEQNRKEHPLYKQVLYELKEIYSKLGKNDKVKEIDLLINK